MVDRYRIHAKSFQRVNSGGEDWKLIMAGTLQKSSPIGIFDSGVGGLSILEEIRNLLPNETILYLADQFHVPYGERSLQEIRKFSTAIVQFFLGQGVKLIVVACNTASAAALLQLRENFPAIPFVGMEPALKPAVEFSKTRRVGVLATPATFQGALYASVVERFARDVTLYPHTCPGLVGQIEAGDLDSPETRAILEDALFPMLKAEIDTVVLGCTHYPFVIPLIKDIVGMKVRVIDPAPAIARQVERLLVNDGIDQTNSGFSRVDYLTSGDRQNFIKFMNKVEINPGEVKTIKWVDENLDMESIQ
jgi:glutamate racemase